MHRFTIGLLLVAGMACTSVASAYADDAPQVAKARLSNAHSSQIVILDGVDCTIPMTPVTKKASAFLQTTVGICASASLPVTVELVGGAVNARKTVVVKLVGRASSGAKIVRMIVVKVDGVRPGKASGNGNS